MKKEEQVYKILLMPIYCDNKKDEICRINNRINTGQKYYASIDMDMTDIAVGFYNIIYKDILNSNPLLKNNGQLFNKEFAGDTMNSFNNIANITPGAGKSQKQRTEDQKWPEYLSEYHSKYHCLANFWLLPMEIGRTTKGLLNKTTKPKCDYMDRFLDMIYTEVNFNEPDREYFRGFKNWEDFCSVHFIEKSYLDKNLNVDMYSINNDSSRIIDSVLNKIEVRAKHIAESKYSKELWDYFNKLQLF